MTLRFYKMGNVLLKIIFMKATFHCAWSDVNGFIMRSCSLKELA
jgi:hypothetical protein